MVDAAATGHGKQSPLPIAPFPPQDTQERLRVAAGPPVGFGQQTGADGSLLFQQSVEDPATADVRSRPSAVFEDDSILAARLLQKVPERGQGLDSTIAR